MRQKPRYGRVAAPDTPFRNATGFPSITFGFTNIQLPTKLETFASSVGGRKPPLIFIGSLFLVKHLTHPAYGIEADFNEHDRSYFFYLFYWIMA